jgi:predicted acylesterase/phospholipase RssA
MGGSSRPGELVSPQGNYDDDYGLPDFRKRFIDDDDLVQFERALAAPEASPVIAINDWRPIHQWVRRPGSHRKATRRTKDETREGFVYVLLKWPFLTTVLGWIIVLSLLYLLTRLYIFLFEHFVTWTGKRQGLRRALRSTDNYEQWQKAAKVLDTYLRNDKWKDEDEYAYYDHATVNTVTGQLKRLRIEAEQGNTGDGNNHARSSTLEELRILLEGCVKNNFVGVENPRLYSETYVGTKQLVQEFVDEAHASLKLLLNSSHMTEESRHAFFKHLDTNLGRTALCLSGGATFSYYHFGVVKALLDNGILPDIISGTSGGALVAALVATRTDEELKQLLVPSLAHKIKACHEGFSIWIRRWWRTGARFHAIDWADQCSWFCRGSTTFREAYERTGRILNVSCVPSDPHSPTILANYLTSPNCVIWSAVIASAAVPGILNPVVLMMKKPDDTLGPYSFGHKWKDGSLRTDIPLKALDVHFNANFSIVSQVSIHLI